MPSDFRSCGTASQFPHLATPVPMFVCALPHGHYGLGHQIAAGRSNSVHMVYVSFLLVYPRRAVKFRLHPQGKFANSDWTRHRSSSCRLVDHPGPAVNVEAQVRLSSVLHDILMSFIQITEPRCNMLLAKASEWI